MLDERMWRAPFGATRDCQLWLLDRSSACREFPLLFSGSPADPPLLSVLELLKHNCRFFWAFFRRQPPIHLFLLMHHCEASRLSSWYGLGIFRSRKGTVEFNRKPKLSKRTWRSCIRSLHRIAHSLCRLGHWSRRFSGRSAHRRGRLTADQPFVLRSTRKQALCSPRGVRQVSLSFGESLWTATTMRFTLP